MANWAQKVDKAKEASFDAIPVGVYPIEVTKADVSQTSNGETMISWRGRITEGDQARHTLFNNFVFPAEGSDKEDMRLSFLLRDLRALGLNDEWLIANDPSPHDIARAMVGLRASAKVGQKEYPPRSGEMRNEINRLMPLQSSGTGMPSVPKPANAGPPSAPPPPSTPPRTPQTPPPAPASVPPAAGAPTPTTTPPTAPPPPQPVTSGAPPEASPPPQSPFDIDMS